MVRVRVKKVTFLLRDDRTKCRFATLISLFIRENYNRMSRGNLYDDYDDYDNVMLRQYHDIIYDTCIIANNLWYDSDTAFGSRGNLAIDIWVKIINLINKFYKKKYQQI